MCVCVSISTHLDHAISNDHHTIYKIDFDNKNFSIYFLSFRFVTCSENGVVSIDRIKKESLVSEVS